ncbi:MAG TPA: nucleotide pyrophosphohydrolase [Bacilli bacterium]|nr:nucleotide pyrophosphohydrolase [Bacilli bacterium]
MTVYKKDHETTLAELREKIVAFTDARNWNEGHRAKNLAMSIAIEAAELMEHFQWRDNADYTADKVEAEEKREIALECADVMIYMLSFCHRMGIDLAEAVQEKLDINEKRFPAVK